MLKADAAGGDVGLEVVFTFDGGVGKAAEHGDLADVIEGVSDRALEESLGGAAERFAGGQVVIKCFDGGVKTIHLGVPWQRRGVVPGLLALSDGEGQSKRSPKCARICAGVRVLSPMWKLAKCSGAPRRALQPR